MRPLSCNLIVFLEGFLGLLWMLFLEELQVAKWYGCCWENVARRWWDTCGWCWKDATEALLPRLQKKCESENGKRLDSVDRRRERYQPTLGSYSRGRMLPC